MIPKFSRILLGWISVEILKYLMQVGVVLEGERPSSRFRNLQEKEICKIQVSKRPVGFPC